MTSHTTPSTSQNRFDDFFQDALYLSLKTSLFNYRFRKWRIAKHVPDAGRILDIGSGTAPASPDLARTVVADLSAEAIKNVSAATKVVTSVTAMSFAAATFDCVICSEVLEHVHDDQKAVAELRRVLKPGGVLIVTVPYQKRFWAEDDEYVGHIRRYDSGELEQTLLSCGFQFIKTYKLSGMLERWLTRKSLQAYQKGRAMTRRPLLLLRITNTLLFLILIITELFTSWKRTTRILIVAS